jgi:hypothetical protein
MKEIEFAAMGKVHIVSNMNGEIIFKLDPILPYRLDFTSLGQSVFTLLVRQGIGFAEHMILPENSVGVLDSSVEFCYKGTCLQEGQLVRILITLDELKRYMSLPAETNDRININGIVIR